MHLRKPFTTALIVGGAMMTFASPALAAPSSPQHPATFTVDCAADGVVTLIEATGAAGFVADSPIHGNNAVAISAEGAIYTGTEAVPENLVYSFGKTFGAKKGLTNRIYCTRVGTETIDGTTYTAFESFVLGLLPTS